MQSLRIFICAMAMVAPLQAKTACDPENEVCHGCEMICSYYADDTKTVTDPQCHQDCQTDIYNCLEGTLPHEEAEGKRYKCIQEKLLAHIRENGDIVTKIVYDVPPTFEEFDQLYEEDGRIDSRDMAVLADILDGGSAPDGTAVPTGKVNVLMEVFREADVDGDEVVTEGEFNAYAQGSEHLGHTVEELHPTPEQKPIEEAHTDLAPEMFLQRDVALMQSFMPKKHKKKLHRGKEVHKKVRVKQLGLAYFQHMLRLGFRVHRAEAKQKHPIGILAMNMVNSPKTVKRH